MRRTLDTLCGLLVAVTLVGCERTDAHTPDIVPPPQVMVVQPHRADMRRTITLSGDLVGYSEAALYAKVSGYLTSISVDKGDVIKKGQILAEIEVPELAQKLKRARATLEIRRLTRERLHRVWDADRRLVAREDVDIADGRYEQAQADVEELEALFSYTHIIAPFDGIVTARFVDPGALIQAGATTVRGAGAGSVASKGGVTPVVRVADISRLRVYVYVPEADTSAIRVGIPATLVLREFPGRRFTGVVARFDKALDLSTRTMLTEVDLENPTGELYPGMYADVTLELARHPSALQVPSTAVATEDTANFVYAVHDGRLAKVPVTIGLGDEGLIEITQGLTGTEQVVQHVNPTLREGELIEPLLADAESLTPRRAETASTDTRS